MELERRLGHGGHMNPQGDESQHVLDRHVFEELVATLGNDTERAGNVYRKFVESATARLEEVRHQSVTDSAATFHALKGSASMVGANRLAALAAKLQDDAPGLDNETKVPALEELEAELATFRDALRALLDAARVSTPARR
jgi:HPt (histidine-containing phosphotransfer) domain-containing protein